MGTDICGYIEVRSATQPPTWRAVHLLGQGDDDLRCYDLFGLLFGIRNYAHFMPVAERRGLPADANPQACRAYDPDTNGDRDDLFGASWCTWREIASIPWDTQTGEDERITEYRRAADGTLEWLSKFASSNQLDDAMLARMARGDSIEYGGRLYRRERITAREVVSAAWQGVFDRMRALATTHGDDGVRLVVWFSD